jgi:potassium-transporting ATPase KdpC subunit
LSRPTSQRGSDKAGGNPQIVAQWADARSSLAQGSVTADQTHAAYVDAWSKAHDDAVKDWIKKNPGTPQPKASDFAVLFGVGGAVPRGIPLSRSTPN